MAVVVGVLLVSLLWSFIYPSNHRNWTADQVRIPVASFDGEIVCIQNLRHATYRSSEDYDVRWYAQCYDLKTIQRVDFVVSTFTSWRGIGHTFLTFGFADGEYVTISVEIRKEQEESFSPLKGLFKQYEIMYVIADERDLIGLRANMWKDPVYLFPIRVTKDHVRTMFVGMLQRANRLVKQPEFYNTLTNSCISNIVRHMEDVSQQDLPFDLRVYLPGYADKLALERGLIDFDGSLTEARQRFLINGRSAFTNDGRAWSRQIRKVEALLEERTGREKSK